MNPQWRNHFAVPQVFDEPTKHLAQLFTGLEMRLELVGSDQLLEVSLFETLLD